MPYYAVKKAFAPIAVQARRDVADISVMLSSHNPEGVTVDLEVFHLRKDGLCLGYWSRKLRAEPGDLVEAFRLKDLYGEVNERTGEVISVCASLGGELAAEDMLFFCPYVEFNGEYHKLKVETEKTGEGKWRLRIGAKTPVRMVELESNQKLLFSDDYFPMVPGKTRVIEVSLLEKTSDEPVCLSAGILGCPERQSFTLD
jgi:hypothetical protein